MPSGTVYAANADAEQDYCDAGKATADEASAVLCQPGRRERGICEFALHSQYFNISLYFFCDATLRNPSSLAAVKDVPFSEALTTHWTLGDELRSFIIFAIADTQPSVSVGPLLNTRCDYSNQSCLIARVNICSVCNDSCRRLAVSPAFVDTCHLWGCMAPRRLLSRRTALARLSKLTAGVSRRLKYQKFKYQIC